MKLKAFVTPGRSLRRLLEKLGEVTDVPQRAPPRPAPYFQTGTQVTRRSEECSADRCHQRELFDESA
ncbi:MAG: hypothetical protein OXU20_27700 [Myxococcales bacterium]|nr:hypothetical protein [Myxococcales bacterium]MDD9972181.1 hypothetical protein [Myxococcales bacterium]